MFPEVWWVKFEHAYAGETRLGGMRKPETDAEVQMLKISGVTGIISLLDDTENHDLYQRNDMDFLWLAVTGGGAPERDQVEQANSYIAKKLVADPDGIITVHCSGGRKRTGTLLAGVMVLNGVAPQEAIDRVEKGNTEIKLSDAQVAFVKSLA